MTDHSPAPPRFAGLWRRFGAFAIDAIVLGCLGWLLGLLLFDPLARLGAWGRLLGFVIAGAYFVLQESRLGGGRTLGKRALALRVVDVAGRSLPFGRAAARYAVFGVPWFLNGAMLPPSLLAAGWSGALLSLLVFGVGGSMLWLLLFNRPARRSLHDLAAGAAVVRADADAAGPPPLARGHAVAVGVLVVASLAAPLALKGVAQRTPFAQMLAMQSAVAAQPGVRYVTVRDITQKRFGSEGSANERILEVTALIDGDPRDAGAQAERLADIAFQTYPEATAANLIAVNFVHGYDIGIASRYVANGFRYTPEQWRDRIAGGAQG